MLQSSTLLLHDGLLSKQLHVRLGSPTGDTLVACECGNDIANLPSQDTDRGERRTYPRPRRFVQVFDFLRDRLVVKRMRHAIDTGAENLDCVNEGQRMSDYFEILLVCGLDDCGLDSFAWLDEEPLWETDSPAALVEELDEV